MTPWTSWVPNDQFKSFNFRKRRRLISLVGYYGFIHQLRPGESLVVEYEGEYRRSRELIESSSQLENLLASLDGTDIYGIFAVPEIPGRKSNFKTEHTWFEDEIDQSPIVTTIHRPVEDLVLSAVARGKSVASDLFYRLQWDKYGRDPIFL